VEFVNETDSAVLDVIIEEIGKVSKLYCSKGIAPELCKRTSKCVDLPDVREAPASSTSIFCLCINATKEKTRIVARINEQAPFLDSLISLRVYYVHHGF
jgi:hypothetical protein